MLLILALIIGFFVYVQMAQNASDAAAAQQRVDDAHMAQVAIARPCAAAHPSFVTKPVWPDWVKSGRVARFDIMGVRLYQPPQLVLDEIRRKGLFTTAPETAVAPCASDMIAADRIDRTASPPEVVLDYEDLAFQSKKSCLATLTFTGHNTSLSVTFVEDYPDQPGCSVSDSIELQEPGGNNAASMAAWNQDIQKKYGKPDNDAFWNQDNGGPSMEDFSDADDLDRDVVLHDDFFSNAVKAATDKAISDDRPLVPAQM